MLYLRSHKHLSLKAHLINLVSQFSLLIERK